MRVAFGLDSWVMAEWTLDVHTWVFRRVGTRCPQDVQFAWVRAVGWIRMGMFHAWWLWVASGMGSISPSPQSASNYCSLALASLSLLGPLSTSLHRLLREDAEVSMQR